MMHRNWKWVWIAPLAIMGMLLFAYLGGKVVESLWNWLMPTLFGLHTVTFWQAVGLAVLARILFGGGCGFMRGGGGGRGRHKGPSDLRKRIFERISDRVVERWDQMTPEEREKLWQRLNEKRAAAGN